MYKKGSSSIFVQVQHTLFCSKKLWKVKFKSYVEISGNLVIFKFKSSWYFACVSAVLPVSPLPIQFNLVETFKL